MILIGGRIFVIFLATRHVCAIICANMVNIDKQYALYLIN